MPRTKAKSVFDGSLPLKRWGQNEIGMGHCAASKVQMISHDDHLRVKPLQQCRMLKGSSQGSRIKKEYFGIKQNHITRDQAKKNRDQEILHTDSTGCVSFRSWPDQKTRRLGGSSKMNCTLKLLPH